MSLSTSIETKGQLDPRFEEVLTNDANDFPARLHRELAARYTLK